MRIDFYLVENKIVTSRERAKEHIKNGDITVNGVVVTKPAYDVLENDNVVFSGEKLKYVGRGGLKLEKALACFNIKLEDKVCLDIGASTGGFTDCMLKNGAKIVYAVDVGHDQLDISLKNDNRVCNMEKTNIINTSVSDFLHLPVFISADVSFVSLKIILPKIAEFMALSDKSEAVVLIKPQFEAGKSNIGKKGIVKDKNVHISVINDIAAYCRTLNFNMDKITYSPICGGNGNIEYLAYITHDIKESGIINVKEIVNEAFSKLK